jgi:hypothetical protein
MDDRWCAVFWNSRLAGFAVNYGGPDGGSGLFSPALALMRFLPDCTESISD